jgi:hypothetical protein
MARKPAFGLSARLGHAERQVAGVERRAGEGNPGERVAEQEEQAEAGGGAGDGGDGRLDGGDHRDLPGRRADQAHRGETLLAAGGGEPGCRADEDEQREQQRGRHDGEDEVQARGVDAGRAVVAVAGQDVPDAGDLFGARQVRELVGGVTDDDDEGVRGWERCRADRADLVSGEAVSELGGRVESSSALSAGEA